MTAPFTPADCDLRGLQYMPLFGDRLFGSATWIAASSDAKVAALRLWWRSYAHEVPAASLPDDDQLLADYAGYGIAVKAWRKIKEQAMRGWVKCDDGRLYHAVVAEVANESWKQRLANRAKQEKWRNRNRDVTPPVTVTDPVTEPSPNRRAGKGGAGQGNVTTTPTVGENARKRATLIGADWIPKPETVAELRKGRPDLVGEAYEAELREFQLWCRSNAVTSHDPEASFLRFMNKARVSAAQRETFDQRRIRLGMEALRQ
ncbi:MAG: DUF1376 domain-containing protein [Alphaproteobacteria bacterium]|nr:DUF1376 domain-containing protein [Alphaproteobacteria bacterium]